MNANGNIPLRSRLRAYLELFLVVLLMMLLAAVSVRAEALPPPVALDGVGCGSLLLRTASPDLYLPAPTLSTEVDVEITGFIARTRVRQSFHNPAGEWLEGIYVFPLPDGAAVDTLHMTVGGRTIEGEIRERTAARELYAQAKSEGKKTSLVEQERANIFTTALANLGPDEAVAVEIEYQEELRYDQGAFRWRFPMVVGPRYIPGAPAAPLAARSGYGLAADPTRVPDAARITPPVAVADDGVLRPVHLRVALAAGFAVEKIASPSHHIQARPRGGAGYDVELAAGAVEADRDFVLEWIPRRGAEPRAALFTEEHGGEFYSLLMVLPPALAAEAPARLPREVIFVLDTSGSMAGASIVQAKAALELALERLQPDDLFNVIAFDSQARKLWPRSLPAYLEHVEEAHRWVEALSADGGTEILAAVMLALDDAPPSPEANRVRQVVFVTDGCVGDEDAVFREISAGLGRSRLFTIGIGSAPNAHFMRQAAAAGRGTYTFIGRVEEVAERMGGLLRKLEHPVVSDLALVWDEAGAETLPEETPDLYLGEPLVAVAKLPNPSGATVSGAGRGIWSARLEPRDALAGAGIHALWARRRIGELEDRALAGVGAEEIRAAVVEVALRHHLVSRHTSLVAIDLTPTAPEATAARPAPLPVSLPSGWDAAAVFGAELPQGATPARLYLEAGAILLLLAGWLTLGARGARR